jgi:hypothetical protein
MINLLPDEQKKEIRAARMNVALLRYNLLTLIALGIMVGLCVLFYIILHSSQLQAIEANSDNLAKAASYDQVRKDSEEYRANLSMAKQIIDHGVNYTSAIFAITKLLPDGVVLDGLTLNAADFGQQTVFTAHAKTYAKATQLKDNFQNSKIFCNVFFQTLADGGSGTDTSTAAYPISISISAKLSKDAASDSPATGAVTKC